jgi:hypothetical protein
MGLNKPDSANAKVSLILGIMGWVFMIAKEFPSIFGSLWFLHLLAPLFTLPVLIVGSIIKIPSPDLLTISSQAVSQRER